MQEGPLELKTLAISGGTCLAEKMTRTAPYHKNVHMVLLLATHGDIYGLHLTLKETIKQYNDYIKKFPQIELNLQKQFLSVEHTMSDGTRRCFLGGKLHHWDADTPAVECSKRLEFYKYGLLNRENDKPARIHIGISSAWYRHGKMWREDDKPVFVSNDGKKEMWFKYFENEDCHLLHRDNDKPAIIERHADSDKIKLETYYQKGRVDRDGDKPAKICCNGTVCYYRFGELHRGDGKPAVVNADGTCEWYFDGIFQSEGILPPESTFKRHCASKITQGSAK